MKTTAIVLNFRTEERTLACLRSLHAAGIDRIILVDNSEDGGVSLKRLRACLDSPEDASIFFLEPSHNLGFGAAINLALTRLDANQASAVLLINSDARLPPSALPAMLETLQRGAAMTAPMVSESGQTLSPIRHYHPLLGLILQHPWFGSTPYFTGACLLLAPAAIGPGLFDPRFFFYGEDVELSARLRAEGRQLVPTANACIKHEGSASARRGSLFYEYHVNRAHWLLARALYPRSRVRRCIALCARCILLPLRAILRSVRARSMAPVQGALIAAWDISTGRMRHLTPAAKT